MAEHVVVDADQQCNMADAGHANHHPHDLSLVRAPASSPVDAPHSTAATWKHTVRPDHEARASTPPPSERLQPRPRDGAGGSGRDGDNTKFEAKLKEKAEKGKGRLERGYDRASRPQGRRRSTTKRKTCCSPDRGEEDKEAHGIEGTSADVAEVKARLARKKEIVAEHAAATLACLWGRAAPRPPARASGCGSGLDEGVVRRTFGGGGGGRDRGRRGGAAHCKPAV